MIDKKDLAKFSWDLIHYAYNHAEVLTVSEDVRAERIMTCRSCDQFAEIENSCKLCGCYIPSKASGALDSCPVKKWDADYDSWDQKFEKITKELDKTSESN